MNLIAKTLLKTLLLSILRNQNIIQKKTIRKKSFRHFYSLKKQVWKDNRKRNYLKKKEILQKYIKMFQQNRSIPDTFRKYFYKWAILKKTTNTIRNRCIQCGQAHAVYKKWRLSRICFREQVRFNKLHGIRKQ